MNINCTNCRYVVEHKASDKGVQMIGQSAYVCRRLPPQVITIPQRNGVQLMTQFPVVDENIFCYEYKPIPSDG